MSSSPLCLPVFFLAVILVLSAAQPSLALFETSSVGKNGLKVEEGADVYVALNNLLENLDGFRESKWFDSGFAFASVKSINDKHIAIRYVRWTQSCTVGDWESATGNSVLEDFRRTVTYLRPYLLQGYSWASVSNGYAWVDYYLLDKDEANVSAAADPKFRTVAASDGEYRGSSASRYSPVEKTGFVHCPVSPLVLLSHNSGIWNVLKAGEYLTSANRRFRLTMKEDCNLVLSDTQSTKNNKQRSQVLWSSKTAGRGSKCFLRLQSDANLVIYNGNGEGAVWAINQGCGVGCVKFSSLVIEDDGTLVLFRSEKGKLVRMWNTKSKSKV
ncbi:uncharacterized protein LOC131033549 [Cryptomeria japonica]|uniref:uncharacterized protein LOC131033549 n=1 Tax=Cryptomeria japonica TaxID=3369 RepID=UPI0027DAB01F|nr:uncharacterized protein LOC131033549 [Cryptomeria japonica]